MGGSGSEAGGKGSVETAKAGSAMEAAVAREASGGKGGQWWQGRPAVAREATARGHWHASGSGVGYLAGLELQCCA